MKDPFSQIQLHPDTLETLVRTRIPHWLSRPGLTRIVTLNGELFTQARLRPSTLRLIRHTPCIADGIGVIGLFRFSKGVTLPRVPGISLIEALFQTQQYRFYFIGAPEEIVMEAVTRLNGRYPNTIVGAHHGYFTPGDWPSICAEIQRLKPDIILVGMGFPRQEQVLMALAASGVTGVGIGVGGAFEVWAKRKKRAPRAFQAVGLEWLWRLIISPQRIRRFGFLPAYFRLFQKR